jgi:hypothetical protein
MNSYLKWFISFYALADVTLCVIIAYSTGNYQASYVKHFSLRVISVKIKLIISDETSYIRMKWINWEQR